MTDFKSIYLNQAAQFDRLVTREDYHYNSLCALNHIRSMQSADIVVLGAGTGRLTLMVAPIARSILVTDASQHMLEVAAQKLRVSSSRNWQVVVGDNRALPLPDRSAEVSIAGWSLGHTCGWYPNTRRQEIDRAIQQMRRVLRRDGLSIILETLGTECELPHPPSET
ncbi:MAG TPA: class I SAM-dependent methyltransferase [Anaerolineae bacterium]|nr:class I SAM-dependent methyltransferase [Anaerolineae bacterium]